METSEEIGTLAVSAAAGGPLPHDGSGRCAPKPSAGDENIVHVGEPHDGSPGLAPEPPKVIRVAVDSLNPHPNNFKIFRESLQDAALESMARDIAVNGQHEPIIVNPRNTILEGHRRCRALQLAGIPYADVIVDYTPRSVEE